VRSAGSTSPRTTALLYMVTEAVHSSRVAAPPRRPMKRSLAGWRVVKLAPLKMDIANGTACALLPHLAAFRCRRRCRQEKRKSRRVTPFLSLSLPLPPPGFKVALAARPRHPSLLPPPAPPREIGIRAGPESADLISGSNSCNRSLPPSLPPSSFPPPSLLPPVKRSPVLYGGSRDLCATFAAISSISEFTGPFSVADTRRATRAIQFTNNSHYSSRSRW